MAPLYYHELELGGLHFPPFSNLPPYGDAPLRGWTLLVQLTEDQSGIRPVWSTTDSTGKRVTVAWYTAREQYEKLMKDLKPGYTVAIQNALMHQFADGQRGVRLEDGNAFVILPISLADLQTLNTRLCGEANKSAKCAKCGKDAPEKRCSRCAMAKYCDQACQTSHWTEAHKRECKAMKQLHAWNDVYE